MVFATGATPKMTQRDRPRRPEIAATTAGQSAPLVTTGPPEVVACLQGLLPDSSASVVLTSSPSETTLLLCQCQEKISSLVIPWQTRRQVHVRKGEVFRHRDLRPHLMLVLIALIFRTRVRRSSVAAGDAQTAGSGGAASFVVVRYNTDGTLDSKFGTNGVATTSFGKSDFDQINSILLQPNDGEIVAGGTDVFFDKKTVSYQRSSPWLATRRVERSTRILAAAAR